MTSKALTRSLATIKSRVRPRRRRRRVPSRGAGGVRGTWGSMHPDRVRHRTSGSSKALRMAPAALSCQGGLYPRRVRGSDPPVRWSPPDESRGVGPFRAEFGSRPISRRLSSSAMRSNRSASEHPRSSFGLAAASRMPPHPFVQGPGGPRLSDDRLHEDRLRSHERKVLLQVSLHGSFEDSPSSPRGHVFHQEQTRHPVARKASGIGQSPIGRIIQAYARATEWRL